MGGPDSGLAPPSPNLVKVWSASGDFLGTGFFVAARTVVTCAHVVEHADDVRIGWSGPDLTGRVLGGGSDRVVLVDGRRRQAGARGPRCSARAILLGQGASRGLAGGARALCGGLVDVVGARVEADVRVVPRR